MKQILISLFLICTLSASAYAQRAGGAKLKEGVNGENVAMLKSTSESGNILYWYFTEGSTWLCVERATLRTVKYKEVSRDEWEVKIQGNDGYVLIDLWLKLIHYKSSNHIAEIIEIDSNK